MRPVPSPLVVEPGSPRPTALHPAAEILGPPNIAEQKRLAEEAIAARWRAEHDLIATRQKLAAEERALNQAVARRRAAEAMDQLARWSALTIKAFRDAPRPERRAVVAEPPRPRTATIEVLMPAASAELVVKGEVGKGDPDEWYGPKRTIHTRPMTDKAEYLIGAFWKDAAGQPRTTTCKITVRPGVRYEVDLRPEEPTSQILDRK